MMSMMKMSIVRERIQTTLTDMKRGLDNLRFFVYTLYVNIKVNV